MAEKKELTEIMEEIRKDENLFEGDPTSWEWFKSNLMFIMMS